MSAGPTPISRSSPTRRRARTDEQPHARPVVRIGAHLTSPPRRNGQPYDSSATRRRYPKEEPVGPPGEGLPSEIPRRGTPERGSPQEGQDPKNPERLYLLTGGAEGGDRAALDLVT